MKGITPNICILCVYVIINKCSFESFMSLDPDRHSPNHHQHYLLVGLGPTQSEGILILVDIIRMTQRWVQKLHPQQGHLNPWLYSEKSRILSILFGWRILGMRESGHNRLLWPCNGWLVSMAKELWWYLWKFTSLAILHLCWRDMTSIGSSAYCLH